MTTQILTTLPSSIDANMLKNKLEFDGIDCFLVNENFTDWCPAYYNILRGGVQVVVKKDDLEIAQKIVHLDKGKVSCPSCGTFNIQLKHEKLKRKIPLLIIGIILGRLLGNLLTDYICQDCNAEFRK